MLNYLSNFVELAINRFTMNMNNNNFHGFPSLGGDMEGFKYRTYGRMELAQQYFPYMVPRSAFRKLMQWIDLFPNLNMHLSELGYVPHQRTFTPAQVRLIVEALGEP